MKAMTKKQKDIVSAACREFEEFGFAGTSMERIADAAKVSKRTLYKHYGSKEAVFSAIIHHLRESSDPQGCPEYDPEIPLREQLEALVHYVLVHLSSEEHIRLSRIVISAAVGRPEVGEFLARTVDFSDNAPYRWIKAAMDDGRLRGGDPDKALFYLSGLLRAVALWPRLIFCADPLSEQEMRNAVEECSEFFLAYYQVG